MWKYKQISRTHLPDLLTSCEEESKTGKWILISVVTLVSSGHTLRYIAALGKKTMSS